jgi:small subunit ribosomal protein S17
VEERGRRKVLVGTVVSNKMDKTAVVAVERRTSHRLYKKIIKRTNRYKAHDSQNEAQLGDVVRIVETRPLSKDKRWRIEAFLTRGNVADVAPRDIGAPEEAIATPVAPVAAAATPAPAAAAPVPVAAAPVEEAPAAEAPAAEAAAVEAPVAEAPPEEATVVEEAPAADDGVTVEAAEDETEEPAQ